MPKSEAELLTEAEKTFDRARKLGTDIETLDEAIEEFRKGVKQFEALDRPLATAICLTNLGAQLVNRAWTPPNLVNLKDAAEAESVLSRVVDLASTVNDPLAFSTKANALAWRARARTFLAEKNVAKNDAAIEDAKEAVAILALEAGGPDRAHDLAIAHLHLARAHFFRAVAVKSLSKLLTGNKTDLAEVHRHASEALELDPADHHIQVQATWLLEKAR